MKKDKDKKKRARRSLSLTQKSTQKLTPAEKKQLKLEKKRMRRLKRKPNGALTENEVENLYVLPPDDPTLEEEQRELQSVYYLKISGRFRIAAWISVLIFALWLGMMFIAYRDEITVENFRFLMRNVNFRLEASTIPSEDTGGIIYSRDDGRVFAVYKDYFASVGNGRIMICDSSGNKAYDEKNSYSSPVLKSSSSYLLCFDRGGNEYSLYSYFNSLGSEKFDYPITDAAISDSGYYAVATRDRSHYCMVNVYSDSMKLVQTIRKNKYAVSIDISNDGSQVIVTSFYAGENGKSMTEVAVHSTSSTEPDFVITLEGTIPYEARYLENGSIVLVGDNKVCFIDKDGKITKELDYSSIDGSTISYKIGEDRVLLLIKSGADNIGSKVLEVSADAERSFETDRNIYKMYTAGDDTALITDGGIILISSDAKIIGELTDDSICELLIKGQDIYACHPTRLSLAKLKQSSN